MGTGDFTRAEIEAGRRLFAGDWQFVAAAGTPASLPPMRGIEIAFAGRSNVGKSSLINALTGRKNLARISRTPGRTQELIFFTGGESLNVVDMPGYGYAAAAKSKIEAWTALIDAFLRGRSNLARVYVLVDARHGLKSVDDPALDGSRPGGRQSSDYLDQMRRAEAGGARQPHRGGGSGAGQAACRLSDRARDIVPGCNRNSQNCARLSPAYWRKEAADALSDGRYIG